MQVNIDNLPTNPLSLDSCFEQDKFLAQRIKCCYEYSLDYNFLKCVAFHLNITKANS